MSWFSKVETEVQKGEAEVALELVRTTGEAHVKAITAAANVAARKQVAAAAAAATVTAQAAGAKLVAQATATAQAAVAAAVCA